MIKIWTNEMFGDTQNHMRSLTPLRDARLSIGSKDDESVIMDFQPSPKLHMKLLDITSTKLPRTILKIIAVQSDQLIELVFPYHVP